MSYENVISMIARNPLIPSGAAEGFLNLAQNGIITADERSTASFQAEILQAQVLQAAQTGASGSQTGASGSQTGSGRQPAPPGEDGEDTDRNDDRNDERGEPSKNSELQQELLEESLDQLNELRKGYQILNVMGRKAYKMAEVAKHSKPSIQRAVGRNFINVKVREDFLI